MHFDAFTALKSQNACRGYFPPTFRGFNGRDDSLSFSFGSHLRAEDKPHHRPVVTDRCISLKDLYWLCVAYLNVSLTICAFRCTVMSPRYGAALYLQDVIHSVSDVTSRRRLRSASSSALVVPAT